MKREMSVWKGLRHQNVLPFIGSVTLDRVLYAVAPWMPNGDALKYLRQNPDADRVDLVSNSISILFHVSDHHMLIAGANC